MVNPAEIPAQECGQAVLSRLMQLLSAPRRDLAENLSTLLGDFLPHSALFLLGNDVSGLHLSRAGDRELLSQVTRRELDAVCASLTHSQYTREVATLGRLPREVFAAEARSGAVLVLVGAEATGTFVGHDSAASKVGSETSPHIDELVAQIWQLTALFLQQAAAHASPFQLLESRAVSSARTEAVVELTGQHRMSLETILATLRSSSLDDRSARQTATTVAASAVVRLRAATDQVRRSAEEPVSTAFERLMEDLRPLVQYSDINVQFVEPPVDGRALPSEVAHGARAIVQNTILALVDQQDVNKVRVQWDCDGKNLLIDVRDDGPGGLSIESVRLQPLQQRVRALNGTLKLSSTDGWGSEVSVVMPLDPPSQPGTGAAEWDLAPRELEVLAHLAAGRRNKEIAHRLGISENTVKFHVSKVLHKLGVTSRGEATAIALKKRILNHR